MKKEEKAEMVEDAKEQCKKIIHDFVDSWVRRGWVRIQYRDKIINEIIILSTQLTAGKLITILACKDTDEERKGMEGYQ